MNVMRAASDEKFVAGGKTITGWHDCCWMPDSNVWKSSEKNVLQPLSTSRCALIFRPSATIVQSDRCDWSKSCGNVLSRDVYGVSIGRIRKWCLSLLIRIWYIFFVSFIFKIGIWARKSSNYTSSVRKFRLLGIESIPFLSEIGVNQKSWAEYATLRKFNFLTVALFIQIISHICKSFLPINRDNQSIELL